MSESALLLVLPYPDSRLLPNRKADRWTRMKATRSSRTEAYWTALAQVRDTGCVREPIWRCRLTITWYPKNRRIADCDSLETATKPLIDGGLVDTRIIRDDSWDVITERTLRRGKPDKANPRTEVEITPVDEVIRRLE